MNCDNSKLSNNNLEAKKVNKEKIIYLSLIQNKKHKLLKKKKKHTKLKM